MELMRSVAKGCFMGSQLRKQFRFSLKRRAHLWHSNCRYIHWTVSIICSGKTAFPSLRSQIYPRHLPKDAFVIEGDFSCPPFHPVSSGRFCRSERVGGYFSTAGMGESLFPLQKELRIGQYSSLSAVRSQNLATGPGQSQRGSTPPLSSTASK
jgi:hypothetical protein